MTDNRDRNRRRLVIAAVLAGAAGLALVALGWWLAGWQIRADRARLTDPSWWTGAMVRGLGYLAFSKAGFKLGLIVVAAAGAGIAWLRARRRER
ncbi:hypothetical protein [Actinoplanes sp. NPDC049681]|uniref:hypothetical protein n=1 Tax=Actinoplanes sp. NPDC049681 TaxID=3363905 RepID=UPI003790B924